MQGLIMNYEAQIQIPLHRISIYLNFCSSSKKGEWELKKCRETYFPVEGSIFKDYISQVFSYEPSLHLMTFHNEIKKSW